MAEDCRCIHQPTRCEQFLSVDNRRDLDYYILLWNKFRSDQTKHVNGECDHSFRPHEPDRGPAAWLGWIIQRIFFSHMRRQHSSLRSFFTALRLRFISTSITPYLASLDPDTKRKLITVNSAKVCSPFLKYRALPFLYSKFKTFSIVILC